MTRTFAVLGRVTVAGLIAGLGYCWVVNRQLTSAQRRAA